MSDTSSLQNRNQSLQQRMAAAGRKLGQGLGKLGSGGMNLLGSFKRGGRVKRTGIYRLHRGERVIPKRRGRR
jgi:hypothetical protein